MKDKGNLIWIDLEMTGLDPINNKILELATIITNSRLDILAEGPIIAIHQPNAVLSAMNPWCTKHHRQSGLIERSRESRYTCRQAEVETLDFIRAWVSHQASPMCGNSICHDRRFLASYMPELEHYFHYRNIDVSTIKELAKRWAPNLPLFNKECRHLACDDIKESIAELKYYGDCFLKKG
jgi:oligoribonuclease